METNSLSSCEYNKWWFCLKSSMTATQICLVVGAAVTTAPNSCTACCLHHIALAICCCEPVAQPAVHGACCQLTTEVCFLELLPSTAPCSCSLQCSWCSPYFDLVWCGWKRGTDLAAAGAGAGAAAGTGAQKPAQ